MKLLALFLSGFVAGVAVSWAYIRSLKSTLRVYQHYVHDRINKRSEQEPGKAAIPSTSEATHG